MNAITFTLLTMVFIIIATIIWIIVWDYYEINKGGKK